MDRMHTLAGAALAIAVAAAPLMAKATVITVNGGAPTNVSLPANYVGNVGPFVITVDQNNTILSMTADTLDPGFTTSTSGSGTFPGLFQPTLNITPLIDGETYDISGSLGVTITTPGGTSNVSPLGSLTNPASDFILETFVGSCSTSIALAPGPVVGPTTATSSTTSFSGTGTFTASAGCDSSMTISLDWVGDNSGASYGFSAGFNVNPIPEPMSIALFGGAALCAVAVGRRRRFV